MTVKGAVATVVSIVLFLAVVLFFSERDRRAENRCTDMGGQTWDSGTHCVLDGRVVSTR